MIKSGRAKRSLDVPACGEMLLASILQLEPAKRATATEALQVRHMNGHSFLSSVLRVPSVCALCVQAFPIGCPSHLPL
jgi:hypothetical protein